MPSTFLGLNTGLSGVNYYQASLNTTGHNIANANTSGYSRQVVLSQAAQALRVRRSYGMMGTGVETTGITRLRNVYYDTKYRTTASKYGQYESIREQLQQLESYLNEQLSESGYTKLLGNLSDAMQTLAGTPDDASARTQYIETISSFTDLINEVAVNYQNTQQGINDEIAIHVNSINSIATQIFSLNNQIRLVETRSGNANDLRDQRDLLVDQLSELVNVTVIETPIMYGQGDDAVDSGATRYEVRIGNSLLVDDMQCCQLTVVAREEKVNQNDVNGLYDIYWQGINGTVGEKFDFNTSYATGKIKGLLEARDGNNAAPFAGKITKAEGSEVTVHLENGMDVNRLNLPQEGCITLNCKEYYYEGWEAAFDADGNLNDFVFKNLTVRDDEGRRVSVTFDAGNTSPDDIYVDSASLENKSASMGQKIDCKGIPYYMTEMNEFVRVFSKYMNDIITQGVDADGVKGLDFFTAKDVNGDDYVLTDRPANPAPPSSASSEYYQLTALNWAVNQTIKGDQRKLVVSYAEDIAQGNLAAKGVLDKVIAGMSDKTMFAQGTPAQFLESITDSLAVDLKKFGAFASNMDEVATVIDTQRLSVSSVDTNEEAANLVVFKQGYNLACKVISVMNEVYDRLINQTGV